MGPARFSSLARTFWLIAVTGLACSGSAPTGPSTVLSLSIQPPPAGLHVGSITTLSATASYSNGRTAPVAASWSSDNAAVAAIDASGRLTATRLGRTAITASYAAVSVTIEVVVTPADGAAWNGDFAGTWSGDSTELSCTRIAGPGPSPCEGQERGGGRFPTTFVVGQQGNTATVQGTVNVFKGSVSGGISGTGHLYLTGQMYDVEAGLCTLRDADFSLSASTTLVGTYSWTRIFTNAFGVQTLRQDWRLLDLTRSP